MTTEGDDRLGAAEEELAAAREADDPERLGQALIDHARALRSAGHREHALVDVAEVIERFDPDDGLRMRELVTWARYLRLRWSAKTPAERLDQAREIFALCNDQPSTTLERRAALALGDQADAQRELGDLSAAIATRRWLISEFGDVRPRVRPELVYDHWYMLANDLADDEQLDDAARTCDELVSALESDGEVRMRQTRIADAMGTSLYPLWKTGARSRAQEIYDELQRRFADADEATARIAAATALSMLASYRLGDGDTPSAVALERELLDRFGRESDATTATSIAFELQRVTDNMVSGYGPVSFIWLTALVARLAERSPAILRRRRLRRVAATLAGVDCAADVVCVMEERFRDDTTPRGRTIHGRAVLLRGMVASRRGRLRRQVAALEDFGTLPAETVEAVIGSASPLADGNVYRLTDMTAAQLTLNTGRDHVQTKVRTILAADTLPVVIGRMNRLVVRTLDFVRR